jgi:hypothetical protein
MRTVFTVVITSIVLVLPALADRDDRGGGRDRGGHEAGDWIRDRGHELHGAPGPIAGAGLPVVAVGYGVYWLIKRRRKVD